MMSSGISETAHHVAESAIEFGRNSGGVKRARIMRDSSMLLDRSVWGQLTSLGWLNMLVSEDRGGLGMEAEALAALAESAGRVLLPEPILPVIAAAGFLAECGPAVAEPLLQGVIEGKIVCVPVFQRQTEILENSVVLKHVPDLAPGTRLLVPAGNGDDFTVRVLESGAAGVRTVSSPCVDGSVLSCCTLNNEVWDAAPELGRGVAVRAAFDRACDSVLLGYSAYLVGLMDEALQITLDYLKVRSQFGVQIGAFQALQHRAATCHVDILASHAIVYEAARVFETPARTRAVVIAKARSSAAALRVTKECVQLHGAIGFTDEHDIGLFLRKAMTLSARHGGEATQIERLAMLMRNMKSSAPANSVQELSRAL